MKKIISFFCFIFVLYGFSSGEKKVILKELINPNGIYVNEEGSKLYISDRGTIFVYSLKNYSLLNSFGRKGEGPGEFKNGRIGKIVIIKNKIIVNSIGRLIYFNINGELIKSIKVKIVPPKLNLIPNGNDFIGIGVNFSKFNIDLCLRIFNKNFEVKKTLLKVSQFKNGKINFFSTQIALNSYTVYKNNIYALSKDGNRIDVLNRKGDRINSFYHGFKRVRINKYEKALILNEIKNTNPLKYDSFKKRIILPENFPIISKIQASSDFLYVIGNKRNIKNKKLQSFVKVFDLKGKEILEKRIELNEFKDNISLISFTNFTLYQLKEIKDEYWELIIKHL